MVVARPLGTSIPVGPVSEQNPALTASLAEAFVFLGKSGVARASLWSAGQPRRLSLRSHLFSSRFVREMVIKETE